MVENEKSTNKSLKLVNDLMNKFLADYRATQSARTDSDRF